MTANQNQPEILTQSIGDARLSYLLYKGGAPTIIMLHATGFLPWLWHPIATPLSDFYQVIAPYFCDHREADPHNGGLEWDLLARDLVEFCRRLRIDRPFVVGHSMGGTVLTIADALYGLNAQAMVLIEPVFLPQDFYKLQITVEQHPLAAKAIKRRNQWQDVAEAREYLLSRELFQTWDEDMLDLYIRYGMKNGETSGLELACSPQKEAALFMGGRSFDPWPLPPQVSCPVLILEGETSENRHFIDLKKVASLFPRGTHRMMAGAGHLIPMEKPGLVQETILEFLQGLQAGSSS